MASTKHIKAIVIDILDDVADHALTEEEKIEVAKLVAERLEREIDEVYEE